MKSLFLVCSGVALFMTAQLQAQNYRYSPANAQSKTWGNNGFPFSDAKLRFQQIHDDLKGKSVLVTSLSFRRGPATMTIKSAVARTIELEMSMGDGDLMKSSTKFDGNYKAASKKVVITKKKIKLPDLTVFKTGVTVQPWSVDLKLDVPWAYKGTSDLVWELKVYSNTNTGGYFVDRFDTSSASASTTFGKACTATGASSALRLTQIFSAYRDKVDVRWPMVYGPPSKTSPCLIFVGGKAVRVPVTGMCTDIYVLQPALILTGVTQGSFGIYRSPTVTLPWDKRLKGTTLHSQGFVYEAGRKGFPFIGSQRVSTKYPDQPTGGQVMRIFAFSPTSASGFADPVGTVLRLQHK